MLFMCGNNGITVRGIDRKIDREDIYIEREGKKRDVEMEIKSDVDTERGYKLHLFYC